MAKQDTKQINISRGQEVEGTVISITEYEVILDLGSKSEGVLTKKDLSPEQLANLKMGDKIQVFVIRTESESGQIVVGLHRITGKAANSPRWTKFEQLKQSGNTTSGKVLEVNKGGLIVEINTIRGFLPSSQISISDAGNLEALIGKDIEIVVIEVDANQNRLILAQKTSLSADTKKKLDEIKEGESYDGKIKSVLNFGLVVTFFDNVDGLVHISEASWEKVEDLKTIFDEGQEVKVKVLNVDKTTGKINLSLKALAEDPFVEKSKELELDDIVKVTIDKITPNGIFATLTNGLEATVNAGEGDYTIGESVSVTIDSIDTQKRKIVVSPFITSTKDLIYK